MQYVHFVLGPGFDKKDLVRLKNMDPGPSRQVGVSVAIVDGKHLDKPDGICDFPTLMLSNEVDRITIVALDCQVDPQVIRLAETLYPQPINCIPISRITSPELLKEVSRDTGKMRTFLNKMDSGDLHVDLPIEITIDNQTETIVCHVIGMQPTMNDEVAITARLSSDNVDGPVAFIAAHKHNFDTNSISWFIKPVSGPKIFHQKESGIIPFLEFNQKYGKTFAKLTGRTNIADFYNNQLGDRLYTILLEPEDLLSKPLSPEERKVRETFVDLVRHMRSDILARYDADLIDLEEISIQEIDNELDEETSPSM